MPFTAKTLSLVLLAALTALTFACGAPPDAAEAPVAEAAPDAPAPPDNAAAPLAPVTSRDGADGAHTVEAPGAAFTLPAAWERTPPSSSMRLAEAMIPGAEGPGELKIFHFGAGGGGGVEAHQQRWIVQMYATAEPQRDSFTVDAGGTEYTVTWIDVVGTLKGGTMGGPPQDVPNSRMLAAVVEGPQGPWFFKATGPDQTLDAARDDFMQLLESVRPSL